MDGVFSVNTGHGLVLTKEEIKGVKLNNQEIWLAYPNLEKLAKMNLPVKTSLAIATCVAKLRQPYMVIEEERQKIVRRYGKANPESKTMSVDYGSEYAGEFAKEFGELLATEWSEDFTFGKIKLPDKAISACPKCNQVTEVPFLFDANSLLPLREKFLE
jgi:hypothetical protein